MMEVANLERAQPFPRWQGNVDLKLWLFHDRRKRQIGRYSYISKNYL